MALTVTPDMTTISLCESTSGWSGGSTNDAFKLEGLYCLGDKVSEALGTLRTYAFGSNQDMSNGEHIYAWILCQGKPDTKANGGIRIYVEDSSGNYGYWYVGGNDNYPGGWICYVLDPSSAYTNGSGTINTASIAKVGIQFKMLSKALGNNPNVFWDAWRYGKGLRITSGLADQIDFDDIVAEEENDNYWGIIRKVNGVFYIQGQLTFGNSSSGSIDFIDKGELIVFIDSEFINTNFYEINILANAGGTTNFVLGEKSGGRGISGCFLKAGTKIFKFTATDANIDKLLIYGSTFYKAGQVLFPANSVNRETINCNFEECGEISANTFVMEFCNIINAVDGGLRLSSISHNVINSNFINCPRAIEIDTTGTYSFNALKFAENTLDIDNTSGGLVTVNCSNGSNPATYSGNTDIQNTKMLTLTGLIENSEVRIFEAGTINELGGIENSSTSFIYEYSYVPETYIDIVVHKEDRIYYRINNYLLPAADSSLPISQQLDRQYSNP